MKKGIKSNNTGYSLKTTDKEPGLFAPGPGKWIEPMDPKKERYMQDYQLYAKNEKAQFSIDPDKLIKYNNKKIKALEKDNFLNFSTLLIDPKRPETQEHAYKLVKELETEPKKYVEETLALQLTLHRLLQTGQLNGREDLDLLYSILDPDFYLPLYPLWDVNGEFLNSTVPHSGGPFTNGMVSKGNQTAVSGISQKYKTYIDSAQKYALKPNPKTYSKYVTGANELNLDIKIQIAKRLMPGLRTKTDQEVFDALKSSVQGQPQLLMNKMNLALFNKKGTSTDATLNDDISNVQFK